MTKQMMSEANTGDEAEQLALNYLQQQGLRLVKRNFQCRMGEIDLIMQDGATLVFVEVRLRRNEKFGGAAASITPHKQRRLILTAQFYLAGIKRMPPCRFDVILLTDLQVQNLRWLKHAFDAA